MHWYISVSVSQTDPHLPLLADDVCPSDSGHKGTIWSLVTHGDRLYSSSSDGTIKEWDIADVRRGCLKTVAAHKEAVGHHSCSQLACSHGKFLVYACSVQVMSLAVGRGILYSAGTDLSLCSWQIDTLDEIGKVEVSLLRFPF